MGALLHRLLLCALLHTSKFDEVPHVLHRCATYGAHALRTPVLLPGAGQQRPGAKRRVLLASRKPPTRRVMLNEDELVSFMQDR